MTTTAEQLAERADAKRRLADLRIAWSRLFADSDDPEVLCELTAIESQIKAAKAALR